MAPILRVVDKGPIEASIVTVNEHEHEKTGQTAFTIGLFA